MVMMMIMINSMMMVKIMMMMLNVEWRSLASCPGGEQGE